eukprot:TRINITY_DN626_c0_g1_i1.p2 TRINITY_DN626_c0_g1~~TRINITY_DN626_c0_g1_i1.p2  ORF type:complete len:175 (-),score=32.63 TRINITY_DN626_c0_g1_i1:497-1021(-)
MNINKLSKKRTSKFESQESCNSDSLMFLEQFKIAFMTTYCDYPIYRESHTIWKWDTFYVTSTSVFPPIHNNKEVDLQDYDLIFLDGNSGIEEPQRSKTGNALAEYIENGGRIIQLGWSQYQNGTYSFGGKLSNYHPFFLTTLADGNNWQSYYNDNKKRIKNDFIFGVVAGCAEI